MSTEADNHSIMKYDEAKQIIEQYPDILRVVDYSLYSDDEGKPRLLLRGMKKAGKEKRLRRYPGEAESYADVDLLELQGYLDSYKTLLPTTEEQILSHLNKISKEYAEISKLLKK